MKSLILLFAIIPWLSIGQTHLKNQKFIEFLLGGYDGFSTKNYALNLGLGKYNKKNNKSEIDTDREQFLSWPRSLASRARATTRPWWRSRRGACSAWRTASPGVRDRSSSPTSSPAGPSICIVADPSSAGARSPSVSPSRRASRCIDARSSACCSGPAEKKTLDPTPLPTEPKEPAGSTFSCSTYSRYSRLTLY